MIELNLIDYDILSRIILGWIVISWPVVLEELCVHSWGVLSIINIFSSPFYPIKEVPS